MHTHQLKENHKTLLMMAVSFPSHEFKLFTTPNRTRHIMLRYAELKKYLLHLCRLTSLSEKPATPTSQPSPITSTSAVKSASKAPANKNKMLNRLWINILKRITWGAFHVITHKVLISVENIFKSDSTWLWYLCVSGWIVPPSVFKAGLVPTIAGDDNSRREGEFLPEGREFFQTSSSAHQPWFQQKDPDLDPVLEQFWKIKLQKIGWWGSWAGVWYWVDCLLIAANHPFKSAPTSQTGLEQFN